MVKEIINKLKHLFFRGNAAPDGGIAGDIAGQEAPELDALGLKEQECTGLPTTNEAIYRQIGLFDYTTDKETIGFYIDPENRWVKLAETIFQPGMEEIYKERMDVLSRELASERFERKLSQVSTSKETEPYARQLVLPNIDICIAAYRKDSSPAPRLEEREGRPAYPLRVALGILVAQGILGLDDREITKCVQESPYLQFFLGYDGWSTDNTVHPTSLVHFRKRLDLDTMDSLNEIVLKARKEKGDFLAAAKGQPCPSGSMASSRDAKGKDFGEGDAPAAAPKASDAPAGAGSENRGTLVVDATCGPVYIRYPQDFSLLNEARRDLDDILDGICTKYGFERPRTHRIRLQKKAQSLSKDKRKSKEKVRAVILLELNAIERNLGHIEGFLGKGALISSDEAARIHVIRALYAQQKYMYENQCSSVPNRIVSIGMPFIRPIMRGKTNRPTEFGPKFDLAVDENGDSRIVYFSFDAYNEYSHLTEAVNAYLERTGHYPESVKVDQIYRTKANIAFCKELGIRISGPSLGRKPSDSEKLKEQIELEKQDMVDRIAVERHFSREKRCFGLEKIMARTPETVGHVVGMSVFLDNMVPVGF